jgi:hypothetical protein
VRAPRILASAGAGAIALTLLIFGYLHVAGPTATISPYRRTISQYALTEAAPAFNAAVLLLAAGSVATMLALTGAGVLRVRSGGFLALALWSAALAAVVYFPKHNWAVGPSTDGTLHRVASVVAFLSLPIGALLIGRSWWRDPRWGAYARWTLGLGALSVLCLTPILFAVVTQPWTGVAWWRAIPLGAVERVLAFSDVVVVLALAWWAVRAGGNVVPAPDLRGVERPPSRASAGEPDL